MRGARLVDTVWADNWEGVQFGTVGNHVGPPHGANVLVNVTSVILVFVLWMCARVCAPMPAYISPP